MFFLVRYVRKGGWLLGLALNFLPASSYGQQPTDVALAQQQLASFEAACRREAGRTWGKSLYGPVLLVEPASRRLLANVPDSAGLLHAEAGLYTGQLPAAVNIANTAVQWGGRRWSMLRWPLQVWPPPEDDAARLTLLAHEAFHRLQPQLGFRLPEADNAHLDEEQGRVYLLLELAALRQALTAPTAAAARPHVQAALAFRAYRRQLFPAAGANENTLELNEGLAEYTGQVVGAGPRPQATARLLHTLDYFTQDTVGSFVRSFAYYTVPLYGFLLRPQQPTWTRAVTARTDLTALFGKAFGATLPADLRAQTQAALPRYGGTALLRREQARERHRQQQLVLYRHQFLEAPHLEIPLRKMNMAFNPSTAMPLGAAGTVYPTLRVTDEWGVLEASAGALMGAHWEKVTVAYPTAEQPTVQGPGYTLTLNPGWQLHHDPTNGHCTLRKSTAP
ncbi:hypothetical protein [Hymenobacter chitinivorans]|uniref:Uncharacterized protein n=1 Tax=Hymenobacter chitinivorans DSM 11115 TaxID=1121954 RepID=A0A2M9AQA1_9BACT|nr:hypothetical protein [Hymenobacter chitinivorans]PJJ47876.1 hypothetical protein CLV45_4566 [Hymenobacter chitinivorans DSM 11115]